MGLLAHIIRLRTASVPGSSICVQESDGQFRVLDVGVVTKAGERDRWGIQPG